MLSVDWGLAKKIAVGVAGAEAPPPAPDGLDERARDAQERIAARTGLVPEGALPPVEWIGRDVWIDANLATMRTTLTPLLEKAGAGPAPLRLAGGALLAAEIGALLGLFSRRVLGQYDVSLMDEEAAPRLLLVGPNLVGAARELDVDPDDLVTWVTVHEVTHAVQFGAVPWLRGELGGSLRGLLSAADVKLDLGGLLKLDLDDLKGLVGQVRDGGLVMAVAGPERKAMLDNVQARMSLVEGHAEHVMDLVGGETLAALPELREALNRRRAERAPLLKILDRLLGMELKLRQYEDGRRFCDAVDAELGQEGLRIAWSSPAAAPTRDEIMAPEQWLLRHRAAA